MLKLWLRDVPSVAGWSLGRLLGRQPAAGVRILVYHAIAEVRHDPWRMTVPPRMFEAQLRWLRRHGYALVSLDETLAIVRRQRPMPPKAAAITFDDGFADLASHALPILERERVPATLFVVPRYLDEPGAFPWIAPGRVLGRCLTWDELQPLARRPLLTIGSHSQTHRCLRELPIDAQRYEVRDSKAALERQLGCPVRWFAYPFGFAGSFSDETIRVLQDAGYEAACTNGLGLDRPGDSPWMLRRTRIGWEDAPWRFALKLAGAYDWIDAPSWAWRRRIRGWAGTSNTSIGRNSS